MRILITGGGGFLGSTLSEKLKSGYDIVCLDHGRNYNFLDKYFDKKVTLVKGDVSDKNLLRSIIRDVDIIIHLAGIAGERRCLQDPLKSNISNIYSTYTITDIAESYKIKRIIFSSSYWVYSTFLKRKMPLSEDSKLNTDSLYGAQKVLSEMIIKDSNIPYDILRISALYGYGLGVGSQWEGVIGKFIKSAFLEKPITIYGTGEQKIDFVYVEDIAEVIKRLVDTKANNEIFNLGSGEPTSILEVANIFKKIFKREYTIKVRIKKTQAPAGKIWPDKWLSVKKIKNKIKQYPFTTLEGGIRKTVKDFEPHYLEK